MSSTPTETSSLDERITESIEITRTVSLKWPGGDGPALEDQRATRIAPLRPGRLTRFHIKFTFNPKTGEWVIPFGVTYHVQIERADGTLGTAHSRTWYGNEKPTWMQEIIDRYLPRSNPSVTWTPDRRSPR